MTDREQIFDHPDLVLQSLKKFKNIDWMNRPFDDLNKTYRNLFKFLPVYPIKIKKGTLLFRGRKNGKEDVYHDLSQIAIKPKEYVDSFGRANIPNQAVFYCSSNEETVVREVTQWYINDQGRFQDLISKKALDRHWNPFTCMITISAWMVKEDITLALLFNADKEKRSPAIQQYELDRLKTSEGFTENEMQSCNHIINFFSQEFGKLDVKHEYDYLYSAFYANEVYNWAGGNGNTKEFEGVKYASIANDCRGENYALSEHAFKKLDFIGANLCYTYNKKEKESDTNETIIGRSDKALLQNDNSFIWVPFDNSCDYIVKYQDQYLPLKLPAAIRGNIMPVKRIP